MACLEREPDAVLAYAGVRHHYNRCADGIIPGECLQLVQCLHRRTGLHLHLHPNVDQAGWVREFSQYDAGWLHAFDSANGGEIRRADWDDLNIPARVATLAAAGLPMIQFENAGAIVAAQALARRLGIGIFFDSIDGLARQLHDGARMAVLRERVWQRREQFCFDAHAPALLAFFERVIDHARRQGRAQARAPAQVPGRRAP